MKEEFTDTELERRLQKNLRRLRLRAKYRQEDLAPLLHLSRSAYSYFENGHTRPSVVTLYRLCSLYSATIEDFFRE